MRLRLLLLAVAAVALLFLASSATAATRGVPNVISWFEAPGHEPGSAAAPAYAVQQRGYYSITAQIHTQGLTPGHRYTMWWVIYNTPSSCANGCGFDDVDAALDGANPAGIGVFYGGTFVAAAGGVANVSTRILENTTTGCVNALPFKPLCQPLIDAAVAEADVLTVDNGPASDEVLPPAVDLFSYGCKTYTRLGEVVQSYGPAGFDCFNAQIVHLP